MKGPWGCRVPCPSGVRCVASAGYYCLANDYRLGEVSQILNAGPNVYCHLKPFRGSVNINALHNPGNPFKTKNPIRQGCGFQKRAIDFSSFLWRSIYYVNDCLFPDFMNIGYFLFQVFELQLRFILTALFPPFALVRSLPA